MRRGLAASASAAAALVEAGRILVSGAPATKPERLVAAADAIVVRDDPPPFVGRGGAKLAGALDRFPVVVAGRRALDAGASTGGFTDCLLQRGAAVVVAVDVGRNQLHERLAKDPRVDSHQRTDVRDLSSDLVGGPFPLIVADLSFISVRSVTDALLGLAAPAADLVVLVKPQFEAERAEASRGRGVITDPAVWCRTLTEVAGALSDRGAAIMDAMVSPLRGTEGNVEFFLHAVAPHDGRPGRVVADLAAAVAEVGYE